MTWDLFLAYAGSSALRFSGFLITDHYNINRPRAFCPIGSGLEAGGALWRRDVRHQLLTACRIASSAENAVLHDAIDLSPQPHGSGHVQPWLYGLSCVPLSYPWDGQLMYPRPFCPRLFGDMASQPEARSWLLQQQPSTVSPDLNATGLSPNPSGI